MIHVVKFDKQLRTKVTYTEVTSRERQSVLNHDKSIVT